MQKLLMSWLAMLLLAGTLPVAAEGANGQSGRLVFIDPHTGEPRAPTPEEAQALQDKVDAPLRTTPPAPVEIINLPDGSSMARVPNRQRSVLQIENDADGAPKVSHGQDEH